MSVPPVGDEIMLICAAQLCVVRPVLYCQGTRADKAGPRQQNTNNYKLKSQWCHHPPLTNHIGLELKQVLQKGNIDHSLLKEKQENVVRCV